MLLNGKNALLTSLIFLSTFLTGCGSNGASAKKEPSPKPTSSLKNCIESKHKKGKDIKIYRLLEIYHNCQKDKPSQKEFRELLDQNYTPVSRLNLR